MSSEKDFCILYCGEDCAQPYAKKFIELLHKKLTESNQRVYYARENGQGDAYNNVYQLIDIISGIRDSVIIYISDTYVNRIAAALPDIDKVKLVEQYSAFRNGQLTGEYCTELNKIQLINDVLQKELLVVFLEAQFKNSGNNNVSHFIHYVHARNFKWDNIQKRAVGDFVNLGFDFATYFDLSSFQSNLQGFEDWQDEVKSTDFVSGEVSKFIVEYCKLDINKEKFKAECAKDSNRAFHTILQHAQHVYYDRLTYDLEHNNAFRYLPQSLYEHFSKLLKHLTDESLEDTRASCWPVWFDDLKECNDGSSFIKTLRDLEDGEYVKAGAKVNSCSACFGALRLSNWYNQPENKEKLPKLTELYIRQCIEGARNMILLLRDDSTKLWKESVVFGQTAASDSIHCLNDTTLCLSTLLVTGFLNKELRKNDIELYRRRYDYISESIVALINKGDKSQKGISWAWAEGIQPGSTLMTALCLDVLVKFADLGFSELSDDIDECINGIVSFFESVQTENGAFTPCEAEPTQESYSHTAKICNSLCTLASSKQREMEHETKVIISKGFSYLLSKLGLNIHSDKTHSDISALFKPQNFEEFNIPDKSEYELCGELMTVTFLLKVIKDPDMYLVDDALRYCLNHRKIIESTLVDTVSRFKQERLRRYVDITGANAFVIKSKVSAEGDMFPIYLLYYYDMAVTDMLKYLGKGEA